MQSKLSKRRGLTFMGFALVALVLAACGSTSKSGTTAKGTTVSASPAASSSALSVKHGSAGTYLVGATGHALYLWEADSMNKSVCSGPCLSAWPAVTASGKPVAGAGVKPNAIGTITTGGQMQLTYDGHPLYYYVGDSGAASTSGQGSDGFGAKWWLVSPAGKAITASSSASSGSTGY
jgi:predicted lipoprotein with Yx(FWY)xxD motif